MAGQQTPSGKKMPSSARRRKGSVDEEQMLDIAEMCFMRIADALIKQQMTVKECLSKYAKPEILPESKAILELMPPSAFIKALDTELQINDLSELEVNCLMRVLAK